MAVGRALALCSREQRGGRWQGQGRGNGGGGGSGMGEQATARTVSWVAARAPGTRPRHALPNDTGERAREIVAV
jgi:hypothetical protein